MCRPPFKVAGTLRVPSAFKVGQSGAAFSGCPDSLGHRPNSNFAWGNAPGGQTPSFPDRIHKTGRTWTAKSNGRLLRPIQAEGASSIPASHIDESTELCRPRQRARSCRREVAACCVGEVLKVVGFRLPGAMPQAKMELDLRPNRDAINCGKHTRPTQPTTQRPQSPDRGALPSYP